MQPYTYFIKHKNTGLFYYGVKYGKDADPNTFWKKYFTSSKIVKLLIRRDGKESFDVQVRRTFETAEDAYNWEQRVIKKIISHEKCLNSAIGFSFDGNKNRDIVDADGLTNYKRCAIKARYTMLNDIDENGLNTYQRTAFKVYRDRDEEYRKNKSKKSSETKKQNGVYERFAKSHSEYQNEMMSSGLTRAQETGKIVSKTRKLKYESGEFERPYGEKNPMAKRINIYNNDGKLMFECNGSFHRICTENNLPESFLKKSYQNNGVRFPKEYRRGMTRQFFNDNIKFCGWYAIEV